VAAPSKTYGNVQVTFFEIKKKLAQNQAQDTAFKFLEQLEFKAHEGPVVCLAVNAEGTLLATASDKVSNNQKQICVNVCL
jgi:hypothetical protein